MGGHEGGQTRGDGELGGRGRGVDAQGPRHGVADLPGQIDGLVDVGEGRVQPRQQHLARVGGAHAARRAAQQTQAQALLERGDPFAQG